MFCGFGIQGGRVTVFIKIAREIVEESIKNVICVDDKFTGPYSENFYNSEIETEIEKELYKEFSEKKCNVSICRYDNNFSALMSKIQNSDLLVLDWELDEKVRDKSKITLEILEKISENSNLSIVCIYTHEHIYEVKSRIEAYFSGYNKSDVENNFKQISSSLIELGNEEILEEPIFMNLCKEFLKTPSKDKRLQVTNHLVKKMELEKQNLCELIRDRNIDIEKTLILLGLKFLQQEIPLEKKDKIRVINDEQQVYLLNGKLLLVRNKNLEGKEFPIKPDSLYEEIANNIWKNPNNFLTLLWLEIKNHQRKSLNNSGHFIKDIDEKVFLNNLTDPVTGGQMDDLQIQEYIYNIIGDELIFHLQSLDSQLLKEIENYKKEKSLDTTISVNDEDVNKMNNLVSFNKAFKNNNRMKFGDIFYTNISDNGELTEKYYINITANCDCLRPSKIDNQFYFVEHSKICKEKDLDKGLYSVIEKDNSYKTISWAESTGKVKVKSFHIEDGEISKKSSKIKAQNHKQEIILSYLGNQKEKYTQRIANHAFSWLNRVGVSYSKYN